MISVMSPAADTNRAGPLYQRAVTYIERFRDELEQEKGVLQKEIAFSVGMSETVFSSKLRGIRSHFYEDEFEALAVYFRKATGRPLIGFPHLEWSMMETIDRKIAGWTPRTTTHR